MKTILRSLRRRFDVLAEAESEFIRSYPAYTCTRAIDTLRGSEYRRLDEHDHTYLDYTGGGVYAQSQVRQHRDLLDRSIFGNPHSNNLASQAMTALVEQARTRVLDYFHAAADEYIVVFTPNATGALKLVAEAYPFAPGARYLLTADNHNSVNGIREFARRRGADVAYVPIVPPELRLDSEQLARLLDAPADGPKLFAFPAQSNFTGVRHSLEWIGEARRRGWHVLLDAAAYVPTNRLDLSRYQPDFVSISFYKMFGYPTGTGALIVRRDALEHLRRPWFAGGTLTFSSVSAQADEGNGFYLTPGAARFEDGTVNYLSIPAVEIGLRWLESIGMDLIHTRTEQLTGWLLEQLSTLRHTNGGPVVRLYGPLDTRERGATLAMNLVDPGGALWDCWQVEAQANARNLSLRAGCHCNPGAREAALGYTRDDLAPCFKGKERISYPEFQRVIHDHINGVVRVSMGVASTFRDVYRFVEFARGFTDRLADAPSIVDTATVVPPVQSAAGALLNGQPLRGHQVTADGVRVEVPAGEHLLSTP